MNNKIHKTGDIVYPCLFKIVEDYQKNYTGSDKMSKEEMLNKIEKYKVNK